MLAHHRDTHFHFSSHCHGRTAGGVLLLVNKSHFPADAQFVPRTLVAGRAIAATIKFKNGAINILNIHNDSLSTDDTKIICDFLTADSKKAANNPDRFASIAAGDLNFDDPDISS